MKAASQARCVVMWQYCQYSTGNRKNERRLDSKPSNFLHTISVRKSRRVETQQGACVSHNFSCSATSLHSATDEAPEVPEQGATHPRVKCGEKHEDHGRQELASSGDENPRRTREPVHSNTLPERHFMRAPCNSMRHLHVAEAPALDQSGQRWGKLP